MYTCGEQVVHVGRKRWRACLCLLDIDVVGYILGGRSLIAIVVVGVRSGYKNGSL